MTELIRDRISIQNIKGIKQLEIDFEFDDSNLIVITGKNGLGKTSIVKSFGLLSDPTIFQKSAGLNAICENSKIDFNIFGFEKFSFTYNPDLHVLDTKDSLPHNSELVAELPVPYGQRFQLFSQISQFDDEIKISVASSSYEEATDLIKFLSNVYKSQKFSGLKKVRIKRKYYYFFVLEDGFYIREDHLSSGEYFLIQLYRFLSSGAQLVLIDEIDISLDASAQVNLYSSIIPVLKEHGSRLILVSHSLAFMQTVDDGCLYYLEENANSVSLEKRSFGYIKSDLYGFNGFDKYILVEDEILENFIQFIICRFTEIPYYKYKIIGVGGVHQVSSLLKKNDTDGIFSSPCNVLCIVDDDVFSALDYHGESSTLTTGIEDIEKFVFQNRHLLLPGIKLENYKVAGNVKKASKTFWKRIISENILDKDAIFEFVASKHKAQVKALADHIERFLDNNR